MVGSSALVEYSIALREAVFIAIAIVIVGRTLRTALPIVLHIRRPQRARRVRLFLFPMMPMDGVTSHSWGTTQHALDEARRAYHVALIN